jgi:capsular exopolysaccharide synthesis family protein
MDKGISYLLGVLKRRSLPALVSFAAVIGGAIAYLEITPHQYESSARLMLDDKSVSVSDLGRNLTQLPSGVPGGPNPLADEAELIKSNSVLKVALTNIAPHFNGNSPQSKLTVEDLSKGLKVKIVPATNILELSYQSKDPRLAAQVPNAIAQAVVDESQASIRREAANVRKFLETEALPEARKRLETTEAAESKYRHASGIVSFDQQTNSLVNSLASVADQERALSAQLKEVQARDASLRQVTDAKAINSAYATVRGGQDAQLKELRDKYTEAETKLIEARTHFTEDHPVVQGLVAQRDALHKLYVEQLSRVSPNGNQSIAPNTVAGDQISQDLNSKLILNEVERKAIEKKLNVVQAERANLQTKLAQLPLKQQPLTELSRKRQEAADSVKLLQSKYEEARIAEAQQIGNVQMIEQAQIPTTPTSPKKKAVLAIAIAFGTVLATGVVLLLEVLDNTLHDASEAEELLKLPLLGVLPRLPAKTLFLAQSQRFLDNVGLVEPYRMLFKTLEFRGPEQLRLVVVSSTISGEGKSVVASHLAAVAAMLSWRTLIIDADLRRPVQHTLFNLPPQPGVTDVIDKDLSLLDAVQPTDIENLDVLTCGELHSRPSQLLESVAMKALMEEASQEYDLVIIDTPPLGACADAASLSRHSDGIVLVTRPSFTLKEALSKTVAELTQNRIPVLGVVVNGMTDSIEKHYRHPVKGYQPAKRLTSFGTQRKKPFRRN